MKKLCRTLKCTKYKVQSTTFKKLQDSIFVIHHSLFFLLLPLLLLPTVLSAQAPNWLLAKSAIDYDADEELCVTTDAAGNILTTGYFAGQSIIFGSTTLNNANPFLNTEDVFIVKYAPN